jgi:hypothetical protein
MFTSLLQSHADAEGPSLWEQCFLEVKRLNGGTAPLADVNSLALLVAHSARGDFQQAIQEILSDPANGFQPELPWR